MTFAARWMDIVLDPLQLAVLRVLPLPQENQMRREKEKKRTSWTFLFSIKGRDLLPCLLGLPILRRV